MIRKEEWRKGRVEINEFNEEILKEGGRRKKGKYRYLHRDGRVRK
jgi:hypothetical protein